MAMTAQDRLGYQLKAVQQALRRRMDDSLRALELTLSQYVTLSVIADTPDLTNADLAARAFITPQSMQGVLANLEAAGLVIRRQDETHGRRQLARLTGEGESRLEKAHTVTRDVDADISRALAPLTEDEVHALFERLLTAMENR